MKVLYIVLIVALIVCEIDANNKKKGESSKSKKPDNSKSSKSDPKKDDKGKDDKGKEEKGKEEKGKEEKGKEEKGKEEGKESFPSELYTNPNDICLPGYYLYKHNCWHFSNHTMTSENAKKYCEKDNEHFVRLSNYKFVQAHSEYFTRYLAKLNSYGAWVDYLDDGKYISLIHNEYHYWLTDGENGANEYHAICQYRKPCEKDWVYVDETDTCSTLVPKKLSAIEASITCGQLGATLAADDSPRMHLMVGVGMDTFKVDQMWLGGHAWNNGWKWIRTYNMVGPLTFWKDGYPKDQECISVYKDSGKYYWKDYDCNSELYFGCSKKAYNDHYQQYSHDFNGYYHYKH